MKHPDPETWAALLSGDLPADEQTEATSHLKSCPECAERVERWRFSINRLERWSLPRRTPHARFAPSMFKWAAAAAIVLGAFFGLGRVSAPQSVDLEALRAELEPNLRAALVVEFEETVRDQWTDKLAGRIHESIESAAEQMQRDLLQAAQISREQDHRAILALLERLRSDTAANYISLRKDLETVASLAENEIQQAQLGLIRLATATKPEAGP